MKLGMIVGSGDLPRIVANHRKSLNDFIHVIVIKGFEESWVDEFPHTVCGIAELGRMIKSMKQAECDTVTLIGNVRRPDFSKLKPDMKGIAELPGILKAARQGDDALLRRFVEVFEGEDFEVLGVQELLEDLVRPPEFLTEMRPDEETIADIRKSFDISGLIGNADIGQGSVVCRGLVLAVEAQEGTDEMLKRVAKLPAELRGTEDERRGVLVKRPKPIQERRIDLPTIGPSTIRLAGEAGLAAVCGVTDGALWVEMDEMTRLANAYGMALISLKADGSLPDG